MYYRTVRVQAFKAIHVFITRLQEHADTMVKYTK